MNSDGAAKGSPGSAGGGVVIHDHRGVCVLVSALAANFGRCHSFRAQITTLDQGRERARDLQISKLRSTT